MMLISSRPARVVDELLGQRIRLDAEHAQLGGSQRAGHERSDDDAEDEDRRDLDPFRPLDHVRDARVDEHDRDRRKQRPPVVLAPRRNRHRDGARGDQHEDAGRVRAGLSLDVGAEDHRHEDADAGEDDDQRTGRPRPFGRHAVARQVQRHEVQQAGHRRGAGEPQNGNRHQRRTACQNRSRGTGGRDRPAHVRRPAVRAETLRRESRRTDTTLLASRNTLMISAAADRSFLVLRILPAGLSSVSDASPRTSGMTATPVSKPDSPSASFGNRMSAITRHHRRVAVLGEQRRAPVGDDVGMPHRSRAPRRSAR